MNAIVLSGGFGTRLMPLTADTPKPMLPVANYPMLDYVAAQLNQYGIRDVVYTLSYLPEIIREFVSGYDSLRARFTLETKPLGTLGGVKAAQDMLDERFAVLSGDALSDIDLEQMQRAHRQSGAMVTMAVTTVDNPSLYGVVQLDDADNITGFVEKPKDNRFGNLINAGVYIVERELLKTIEPNVPIDFSRDLFPVLARRGQLHAYLHTGYWSDIGDVKSYYDANFFMRDGGFYPRAQNPRSERYASEPVGGNLVASSAVTVGRAENCILGAECIVASDAQLNDCIVLSGAVAKGKHSGCILGKDFVVPVMALKAAVSRTENAHLRQP